MADLKWTWQQAVLESELRSTVKLVLMVLASHMNSMGEGCYPSTLRIAKLSSLSERAVITALNEAENGGWIQRKNMEFRGQKWKRNAYFPKWPQQVTEGTERRSAPSEDKLSPTQKALNVTTKGTEPDDKKALNDVQLNKPFKSPEEKTRVRARACQSAPAHGSSIHGSEAIGIGQLGSIARMLEGKEPWPAEIMARKDARK